MPERGRVPERDASTGERAVCAELLHVLVVDRARAHSRQRRERLHADPQIGEFVLTHPGMRSPPRGKIYSFNEGNSPDWDPALQRCARGARARRCGISVLSAG